MPRLHSAAAVAAVCALSAAALIATPAAAIGADPGIPSETVSAAPSLVLNEIVYDDAATGLADQVEIYNAGAETIDLTGWTIADEKRDSFGTAPQGTSLAPGEFLVLVKDVDFAFGLGKGDEVVLFDPSGTEVDSYAYENTAPLSVWARCPDGTGAWAPATAATPGTPNDCSVAPVAGSIVINEVDSQPADWVEFYNPGTEALDISGYEIRDNSDDHRWQFLDGTQIGAGQFLVVEEGTVGLSGGVEAAFREPIGIGSADRIRLYDASGAMIDDTLPWQGHAAIDGDFAAATLARCPDGVGAFVLARPTPGATNSCVMPDVVINEIESNGDATDWVEVVNTGTTSVDLSGWTVMDNDPAGHAAETTPLPAGTIVQPGGYFVFDQPGNFVFGLGNGDTVTVRDANGNTVDEHTYAAHAAGVLARCADGTGDLIDIAVSTKGLRNACGNPVRINEVESDGGSPDDWVELVNPTSTALDVSGIVVKDDDDTHAYAIPAGTSIGAGEYLVIERAQLGFGLGAGDAVRVFDGDLLVDEASWGDGHAATTWGRCPDTTGAFAGTAESTKGAANVCAGEIAVATWPGSADVHVVDSIPTFLEDSSGLDVQETADGAFLWAVDNGEGRIWKLEAHADGSIEKVDGWDAGKRVRFQKDAANPAAAGPDTEGITVDGDGFVYVASERDNSAKGVNQNVVLKVDPDASNGDLVAQQEWDLTSLLPAVGANLGMEAVQWVPDSALAGKLFDDSKSAAYDPKSYAGHGGGLFFVAVEDNGHVYAFALGSDGSATLVSEIAPGLTGVMALDYDSVRKTLWAVCDDGCQGRSAEITLNGTAQPGTAHYARPAGMPDINNEGFATAPASLSVDGQRPVWWFADGFASEALRTGTLPGASGENPGGETPPLPGTGLVDDNRNGLTVDPSIATPGQKVTVTVGVKSAGAQVSVWMYSDPSRIASGTLTSAGTIAVTIPADAPLGAHRIAVFDANGGILGWADIRIAAGTGTGAGIGTGADGLATTGSELPVAAVALALMLLTAGAVVVRRRKREA
ncbi:lamin tail domain-containing protein [Microbacterium maritypicum]|uniref:lamin tail domain-containing protein n=1 Tax=Microbacterium maritypicum TaxID=33918 RepID=UPI001B31AF08|nr:lamin tail domain-containing protein [Microbacterium liquefaciens]MBP5802562.1 lamin tail domain-containing protein [Microbacterium liquefaciens]